MRVLIITKDCLRHKVFWSSAKSTLGEIWVGTVVQKTKKNVIDFLFETIALGCIQTINFSSNLPFIGYIKRWLCDRTVDLQFYNLTKQYIDRTSDLPSCFLTSNINSKDTLRHAEKINPDLIIVFGASILSREWLKIPKVGAINMHYGVLPYYRSGNSTLFALVHERFDLIGSSVHHIDAGVDTGNILSSKAIDISKCQSIKEVIAQTYSVGSELLLGQTLKANLENKLPHGKEKRIDLSYFPSKVCTEEIKKAAASNFLASTKHHWPNNQETLETYSLSRRLPHRRNKGLPNGIYILCYHGIIDRPDCRLWEKCYERNMTEKNRFFSHIEWLIENDFSFLDMRDIPSVIYNKPANKKYFCLTFDDGYSNLENIRSEILELRFKPTIFANASFMQGKTYYRVLAALMCFESGSDVLRKHLVTNFPELPWSDSPSKLFNDIKNFYHPRKTEKAVESAFEECEFLHGQQLNCHLNASEFKKFQKNGWTIGNHTFNHETLSHCSHSQIVKSIEDNLNALNRHSIRPIKWLAYPNGLARHVNIDVKDWLDKNPDHFGIFAGGGINITPTRTQWRRIPVGNQDIKSFEKLIQFNAYCTAKVGF